MHAAKFSRSVQAMYLRGTHFSCWCIVVRHGASIWHDENVLSGKSVFTNKSCTNYPSVTIVSRPRFLVCAENAGQRNLYDTVCFKTTPLPTPFFFSCSSRYFLFLRDCLLRIEWCSLDNYICVTC